MGKSKQMLMLAGLLLAILLVGGVIFLVMKQQKGKGKPIPTPVSIVCNSPQKMILTGDYTVVCNNKGNPLTGTVSTGAPMLLSGVNGNGVSCFAFYKISPQPIVCSGSGPSKFALISSLSSSLPSAQYLIFCQDNKIVSQNDVSSMSNFALGSVQSDGTVKCHLLQGEISGNPQTLVLSNVDIGLTMTFIIPS